VSSDSTKLNTAFAKSGAVIGYIPLAGEPAYDEYLADSGFPAASYVVPPSRNPDPFNAAKELSETYAGKRVIILLPGTAFDESGTRKGRGGGWYDRLLSAIPEEWVRVGVLHSDSLHDEPLERKSWDEPVDFLLILGGPAARVKETHARGGDVVQS
jgi:5,10-methenyltetrahydrofolate synthetase